MAPGPVASCQAALPERLILLVDGVSYRDMKALQEGFLAQDTRGHQVRRHAFDQGFFPVSRLVSTFPSISDPSWSEITGNRPPPGYQRTYFDAGRNQEIFINGMTSDIEFERQMTWQLNGSFGRMMSYINPGRAFEREVDAIMEDFLRTRSGVANYFALIRSTDSAQHLSGDIFTMLTALDKRLNRVRDRYRVLEGHDLQILLLSDHGNNHAGGGRRVDVRHCLKQAGYRIATSLVNSNNVILPTAGIESWIEIHNLPAQTEKLVSLLARIEGVDLVTACVPDNPNQFLVVNAKGDRATIEQDPTRKAFRYSAIQGDPLDYEPVVAMLAQEHRLDADGFASAEDWMTATFTNHYPVALERIARGHTQVVSHPATILVSLQDGYVHCGWWIRRGLALAHAGGTHGNLDDLDSDGILLSNFVPTRDTTTSRVAALFDGFPGRRGTPPEQQAAHPAPGQHAANTHAANR